MPLNDHIMLVNRCTFSLLLVMLLVACNAPQPKQSSSVQSKQTIYPPQIMERCYPEKDRQLWRIQRLPDSQFQVSAGWAESEWVLYVKGRFWFINENIAQKKVRYGFELFQTIRPSGGYDEEEDTSEYKTISEKGEYEVQIISDYTFLVTIVKGSKNAANLMGFERTNQTIDYHPELYWYQASTY